MTQDDIVNKFIEAGKVPSKHTVQSVMGFSAQTLVRRGFKMSDVIRQYKNLVNKPKYCKHCGKEIAGNKIFCNHSCSATYNNLNKVKVKKSTGVLKLRGVLHTCKNCDKVLKKNSATYCSFECQKNFQYTEKINAWKSGDGTSLNKVHGNVSSTIRKYLFVKFEHKCCKCGWSEINPKSGKIPLEVEHINGDSSDNREENLELLCPNCHSLTPTYRALNRGKGRHSRRERYKEGKSF